MMDVKFWAEMYLSSQCVIMNALILAFLGSTKQFRTWQFFPLMLQATVDLIGPGVANLFFEVQLLDKLPRVAVLNQQIFGDPGFISNPFELQSVHGTGACVIMHLRFLVNDYSTGKNVKVLGHLADGTFGRLCDWPTEYSRNSVIDLKWSLKVK